MKINDLHLFEDAYNPINDEYYLILKSQARRPKLTLRHLNRLRKMREAKKLDMKKRQEIWSVMYGQPSESPTSEF